MTAEPKYKIHVPGKFSPDELAPKIEDFLEPVLDLADFDVNYDIESGAGVHPNFESPDVMVRFTGPDTELLVANKAELLLALEHLTLEAMRIPQEDHSRICFDANDYRVMRVQELRMSAEAAAERVKKTGAAYFFNAMTSRERRILHLALRNETELRSESVGMGAFRQVCVLPVDAPLPPAPPPPRRMPDFESRRPGGPGGRDRRGGPRGDRGGDRGGPRGDRGGDRGRGPRRDGRA